MEIISRGLNLTIRDHLLHADKAVCVGTGNLRLIRLRWFGRPDALVFVEKLGEFIVVVLCLWCVLGME